MIRQVWNFLSSKEFVSYVKTNFSPSGCAQGILRIYDYSLLQSQNGIAENTVSRSFINDFESHI